MRGVTPCPLRRDVLLEPFFELPILLPHTSFGPINGNRDELLADGNFARWVDGLVHGGRLPDRRTEWRLDRLLRRCRDEFLHLLECRPARAFDARRPGGRRAYGG